MQIKIAFSTFAWKIKDSNCTWASLKQLRQKGSDFRVNESRFGHSNALHALQE